MAKSEFLDEDVDDGNTEIKKSSKTGGGKKRRSSKVEVHYGYEGNKIEKGYSIRHNVETQTKETSDGSMAHKKVTWVHIRKEDGYTPVEAKEIKKIVTKKPDEDTEETVGYLKENFSFIDVE